MAKTNNTNKENASKSSAGATKSEKQSAKSPKQSSKNAQATAGDESTAKANASADPATNLSTDEVSEPVPATEGTNGDKAPSGDESSAEELLAAERDKYLRLAAEYDNYRKRSSKEREMTYNDARIESVTKLLPVYDNLERALQMECSDEPFYKGIEMIMTQFNDMFENMGVKHIPAVGEPFDPNLHNAVTMITDPNLGENIVATEYQKGFTLGQRVIRFSTVVVAN